MGKGRMNIVSMLLIFYGWELSTIQSQMSENVNENWTLTHLKNKYLIGREKIGLQTWLLLKRQACALATDLYRTSGIRSHYEVKDREKEGKKNKKYKKRERTGERRNERRKYEEELEGYEKDEQMCWKQFFFFFLRSYFDLKRRISSTKCGFFQS